MKRFSRAPESIDPMRHLTLTTSLQELRLLLDPPLFTGKEGLETFQQPTSAL